MWIAVKLDECNLTGVLLKKISPSFSLRSAVGLPTRLSR
jgi:hypothetical protein